MASRWTPKSGKLPSIYDRREGKRMSIKVPKEEMPEDICPPRNEVDPDIFTGRPLSSPRIYTPEGRYNYKSNYARYRRALDLKPSVQVVEGECQVFSFHSCSSPVGFWKVKVCPNDNATFIEAGNPLTILCPPRNGYKLNQVESDGKSFTWVQLSGSRTIIVEPPSDLNPTLFIESTCSTDGCDDGSYLPIVLQVSINGNPELFDYLTIYTTPTDTHYGIGSLVNINLPDSAPCREVQNIYLAPIYFSKAYINNGNDELTITWDYPTCSLEYLTGTSITKNTTGQYEIIDIFNKDEERLFAVQPNVSYRIGSQFNTHGRQSISLSKPFRFTFNNNRYVLADETHQGISAVGKSDFTRVNYSIERIYKDELHQGLAVAAKSDYTRVNYTVEKIYKEELHRGIGCTGNSSFTRTDYGGVIIG